MKDSRRDFPKGFALLFIVLLAVFPSLGGEPVNLAKGRPYELSSKPNYRECTNDDGRTKLTDGTLVPESKEMFWLLPTTVGWVCPSTVTVDLGKSENVCGFFWHGAFGLGSGVNPPESVAVYMSEDRTDWTYAGDLLMRTRGERSDPVAGKESIFMLDSRRMPCRGRYVRFVPAQSPCLFTDEVGVWSGDAAAVDAAWPKLEHGVDPAKHQAAVRLRARIYRDAVRIGGELPDGLMDRIVGQRSDAGLPGIRTELPLNDVHAAVWALNARKLRSAGFAEPVLWKNDRWDNLDALAVPTKESVAFGRLEVEMMRNETRGETVNVLNPTDGPLECALAVKGLPAEAHVDCLEVLFTDTGAGVPVAGALKPGRGDHVVFTVPAGASKQVWISFAKPQGRAGVYDGKVLVKIRGGDVMRTDIRLTLHDLDFPDVPRLHTGGWDYLDAKGDYYKAAGSRASSIRLMKEEMYTDTAWATSHVQPTGARFGADGALLNPGELDFTEWDRWVTEIWPGARIYAVMGSIYEVFGKEKPGTARYDRMAEDYYRAWTAHARTQGIGRGLRPFVLHLVDEPHNEKDFDLFLRAARPVSKVKDVTIYCTPSVHKGLMSKIPQEFFDVCEVMCPGVLNMTLHGYHADYRRQIARGKEVWVYSCHGARTFDPIRYHRVQSWYAFQLGAKGSFFWAYGCGGGIGDSWHAYAQKGIEYSPYFISPADGAMRAKQSEGIREGVEDYELLTMARERGMDGARLAALVRAAMGQDPSGKDDFTRVGSNEWNTDQDRVSMDRSRLAVLRWLAKECKMSARTDHAVPAEWTPKKVMGKDFRPLLPPGPWACPGAYNDKRAKEIGLWPRPDWPLFRDCALFFYALRTPAERIDRPTWDTKTWKVEPGKRRGKTGPLAVEEFFGDDIADILKENPKPDVPFILQLGMSRSAFQLNERYDQDVEGYRKWLGDHPNFIGFELMAESENDIGLYCNRVNDIPDPEVRRRLHRDFPPPKDQREWVRFAGRMWDRMKAFHFGETRTWAMAAGCYSHLHLHGLNGATGLLYEGSASQPLCTWQVAGAFLRGASRQFGGLPFGWYMAHFYNGYKRDGKGRWGENKWCRYPWSTPEKAPKPGDRDYPHAGTSRSLVERQAAYGYLIGASFVMPENAHMLFYETDADGKYRPSGYAQDLNDLYVFSTNCTRGVSYATTAVLVPLSERYGHSFRAWGGGYNEQFFWFDDLFSQNALYHTLVPMNATEPELRKRGFQGALFNSPFGEFWDVLVPDAGQPTADFRKALAAYKCAFLIGAYRKDELDAAALESYVRDGGTLFIPADAVTDGLVPSALAGLTFTGRLATSGTTARDERGRVFELKDEYRWNLATPATATPLVRDDRGTVAVWANDVGKGRVVTVACWRMLPSRYFGVRATLKDLSKETCAKYEKEWWEPIVSGARKFGLFEYLFSRVQDETLPVKVDGDIHFGVNRTPDGWNVWLFNHKGVVHFSEEPEEFNAAETAHVTVGLRALAGAKVTDLRSGQAIPAGRSFSVDVAPGEWKFINIR